jgi:tRNA G37 N-methylase Trm5
MIINLHMSSEMFLDAVKNSLKSRGGIVHIHVSLEEGKLPR